MSSSQGGYFLRSRREMPVAIVKTESEDGDTCLSFILSTTVISPLKKCSLKDGNGLVSVAEMVSLLLGEHWTLPESWLSKLFCLLPN